MPAENACAQIVPIVGDKAGKSWQRLAKEGRAIEISRPKAKRPITAKCGGYRAFACVVPPRGFEPLSPE